MMHSEQRGLDIYRDLFCHRRDLYALQTKTGAYFLRRNEIDDAVIDAHLEGRITAGWYALTPDSTVRWVALDADQDNGLESLQHAWKQLDAKGISSYLELSRRGGHLWTFFEPISAAVARRLIFGLIPKVSEVEIFPKQDRLDGPGRVGSLVRGPLGVHRLSGRRYPFVDPISLKPVSITTAGTLEYLREVQRVSATDAAEHLAMLLEARCSPAAWTNAANELPNHDVPLSPLARVKQQIGDPYNFIAQYVELDEGGRGHCPFHPPDRHPSFAVNRNGGYWIDFHEVNPETGRYVGGDVIEFYRRLKGLSYKDALGDLEQCLGNRLPKARNGP